MQQQYFIVMLRDRLIEHLSIYSNINVTYSRSSDALLRRDAVELDARPRRRCGTLLFVRDVAGL